MRGVRATGGAVAVVVAACVCGLLQANTARGDVWTPVSRTLHAEAHASATGATNVDDTPADKTFGAVAVAESHAASATIVTTNTITGSISFQSGFTGNSFIVSGSGQAYANGSGGPFASAGASGSDLLVFDLNQPTTLYLQFPLGTGGSHYFNETMSLLDSTGATTLASIDSDGSVASRSLPLSAGRYELKTTLSSHGFFGTPGGGAYGAVASVPEPTAVATFTCLIAAATRPRRNGRRGRRGHG